MMPKHQQSGDEGGAAEPGRAVGHLVAGGILDRQGIECVEYISRWVEGSKAMRCGRGDIRNVAGSGVVLDGFMLRGSDSSSSARTAEPLRPMSSNA